MKIKIIKYSQPILSPTFKTFNLIASDAFWAYHPCVIKRKNSYYLFYTGKSLNSGIQHDTLLAKSRNLTTWQKFSKPIIDRGELADWDSDFTAHAFIFEDKGKYFMFYDGSQRGNWLEEIGLAESKNLINWKKYNSNPIFKVGSQWWERRHVSRCCLYKNQGTYYLYYAGHDGQAERIGLAWSKNLYAPKRKLPNPILDLGKKGQWDEKSISDPRVIALANNYLMFYSGIDAGGIERTGIAQSHDLVHWKKYAGNPVLNVTHRGWDATSASRAFPFIANDRLFLFYSGRSRYFYQIGLAEIIIT